MPPSGLLGHQAHFNAQIYMQAKHPCTKIIFFLKIAYCLGLLVNGFSFSTQEAETGGTVQVQGQPDSYSEL